MNLGSMMRSTQVRMYKKRQRHVTLIEVLIASMLTMILLTAIISVYRQVTLVDKESEKLHKEQFKLAYLEKRLSTVIPRIISPTDPSKDFYFFTSNNISGESLIFTYDHGISLKKEKAGHLLSCLYLDGKNLVFASWVTPKHWDANPNPEMNKEILLEDVSSLEFEFYMPPKKDRSKMVPKTKADFELQPENHWHKNWSYKNQELPAMVKIHITKKLFDKTETMTFAFALPNSNLTIMYEGT